MFNSSELEFLEGSRPLVWDIKNEENQLAEIKYTFNEVLFLAYARYIRNRLIKNNKSFIAGFEGEHRSGKSETAVGLAYMVDPSFWPRIEQRIVSTPDELMKEIEVIDKEGIHGAVIIVDEGGVSVASDEFYSKWYKTLSKVFQMFGYLNPCIFFCAVLKDAIGAKFRKLFHNLIQFSRHSNDFTKMKIYNTSYNTMFKKYLHSKKAVKVAGKLCYVKHIKFGKLPKFITDRYKNISISQKKDLMKKWGEELRDEEIKDQEKIDLATIIQEVIDDYKEFESEKSTPDQIKLDANLIRAEYRGVSFRDANLIKLKAQKALNRVNNE